MIAKRIQLDNFLATAVQLYQFDPSVLPPTVYILEPLKITTRCRSHWFFEDNEGIISSRLSTFSRLPGEELENQLRILELVLPAIEVSDLLPRPRCLYMSMVL